MRRLADLHEPPVRLLGGLWKRACASWLGVLAVLAVWR
jgi:hypothetical protein